MKKHILITGGSRGIGAECVRLFSQNGYKVSFIYKSSEDKANEISDKTGAYAICADIGNIGSVREAVRRATEVNGDVDVLINNAGVALIKLLSDVTDEELQRMISVNLTGSIAMAREVSKGMIYRHSGNIINIGSIWGNTGASCEVVYSATKAGIRGLTLSLAKELGPSGIRVNCIEPGVIDTEMNKELDEDTMRELIDETPLCRIGKTTDIANLALFLASDDASFITGQIIGVDGGFGR